MILGFEYFHPFIGECPNTFPDYGQDIAHRARKILKNRSLTDLKNIADGINWILDHKSVREKIINDIGADSELIENGRLPEYRGNSHCSIYAIKHYQQTYALPDIQVKDLKWHEIYATLALGLIDKAVDDEKYYSEWENCDDWLHEWRIMSHSAAWLIEAMEAVTLAEGMLSLEINSETEKNKIKERNTSAAIQRHAKTNQAIIALHEMFATGSYKSMSNAAQIFSEKFPEKVAHLAPYNRIRTLANGLSDYIKGQRRSLKK